MKRLKLRIKLGIDIAMIIAFLFNMFTGFAIFFGLVSGGARQYRGAPGLEAGIADLGTRALYRIVHDWSGIIIIVLILTHLVLNWNTLACYLRNMFRSARVAKPDKSCENI